MGLPTEHTIGGWIQKKKAKVEAIEEEMKRTARVKYKICKFMAKVINIWR